MPDIRYVYSNIYRIQYKKKLYSKLFLVSHIGEYIRMNKIMPWKNPDTNIRSSLVEEEKFNYDKAFHIFF